MFEDSTFESACRIHTRSRQWMLAAFGFNASILMAFILIPLILPPMLPRQVSAFLMEAFVPPRPQPPQQPARAARPATEMRNNILLMPLQIPTEILYVAAPEPPVIPSSNLESVVADPNNNLVRENVGRPVPRPAAETLLRVSSGAVEGLLIQKTMPAYPLIARNARISGTVTLAAIISKTGAIENLRVISGPIMLQQAALDAVRTWRYRPYLLDGQPVEVETTVTVNFTLQR
ncbi:MAG: energy transducer TonB [Terracidiphilus sp.]|jgi:protein TonB